LSPVPRLWGLRATYDDLSYGSKIWTDLFSVLVLLQSTRLTEEQTDRWTDSYSDGPLFGLGLGLAVKVRVRIYAYVRNSGPES